MNSGTGEDPSTARRPLAGLAAFLAICFAVYGMSGWVTARSVSTWYQALARPPFNPPDWLFTPVWTVLFFAMAVAGWRVWRRTGAAGRDAALGLFGIQLALNFAWSLLFFGLRAPGWALIDIAVLWLALAAATALFWRVERFAGLLLLPYLGWVSFAVLLNFEIWRLN